jgi:hypothetical protein
MDNLARSKRIGVITIEAKPGGGSYRAASKLTSKSHQIHCGISNNADLPPCVLFWGVLRGTPLLISVGSQQHRRSLRSQRTGTFRRIAFVIFAVFCENEIIPIPRKLH